MPVGVSNWMTLDKRIPDREKEMRYFFQHIEELWYKSK